jgi:hypothetical protein
MTNEGLIRELVSDAHPVQRLPAPGHRCGSWLALTLLLVAAALALGARERLVERSQEPAFLLDALGLLLLAVLSARSAFQLSVPALHSAATFGLPLTGAALWLVLLSARVPAGALEPGPGLHCVSWITALGVPSLLLCWRMQRRAAPLAPRWTGLFMALAAFSLSALAARVSCARDGVSHLLFWHCVPVLALTALAAITAQRWLGSSSVPSRRSASRR